MQPMVGRHRPEDRRFAIAAWIVRRDAGWVELEHRPGHIDVIPIRIGLPVPEPCIAVGRDHVLVMGDERTVVLCDDEAPAGVRDVVVEGAVSAERGLRDEEAAGIGQNVDHHAAEVGAALGVDGQCRIAGEIIGVLRTLAARDGVRSVSFRGVEALAEGREPVAPVAAVVRRVVETTLVEADPRVVLAADQVVGIGRVEDDVLLGLTPEAAVLVDSNIPFFGLAVALATAERARGQPEAAGAVECRPRIAGGVTGIRAECRFGGGDEAPRQGGKGSCSLGCLNVRGLDLPLGRPLGDAIRGAEAQAETGGARNEAHAAQARGYRRRD